MRMTAVDAARVRELIREALPDLRTIRRDLHAHPELGYEEVRTSAVVRKELERAGVRYAGDLAGGTGVLGHLPGEAAQSIGLRADMDALSIEEETGAPYRSRHSGRMHACGHDGHTTILIGAARVLAAIAREGTLPRPVHFIFQPAEEGGAGGKRMVEDGCLDGSRLGERVARLYGLHGWPRMDLGAVGTRAGELLASADQIAIDVEGRGGHAAFPHLARDPVLAACAIVVSIQAIVARSVDPLDSVVISVTQIAAGTAHNIIPDRVRLAGTVRTFRAQTQQLARERLEVVAAQIAAAHGCRARVEYTYGYPVTENDEDAVHRFRAIAEEAVGPERAIEIERPFMGAEDFAFYCREVPSCFFLLGLRPPGAEAVPDLHQPTFDFNDEAIPTGIEMFVRLALEG